MSGIPSFVDETLKPDINPTFKPSLSINFADNASKHPGITIISGPFNNCLNCSALSFDFIFENIFII